MRMEKMLATRCGACVCPPLTHTPPRVVSVHALRAEKSAALLIFLYSHGGLGRNVGGGRPRPEKPSAEKNRDEKAPLPF